MVKTIIVDELLCFLANKLDFINCDELVSLCTKSFDENIIKESKLTLFNACNRGPDDNPPLEGIKYRRCKGPNSVENNIKDMIKLFQELGDAAPPFAAVNLNALPTVSSDKVDVNGLVNMIAHLTETVARISTKLDKQNDTIASLQTTVANTSTVATYAEKLKTVDSRANKPPVQRRSSSVDPENNNTQARGTTNETVNFSEVADDYNNPSLFQRQRRGGRRRRLFRSGQHEARSPTSKMRGIQRVKSAELFITRLSPNCEPEDVKNFILANLNLNATVEKIESSRNTGHSTSFHVSCECPDPKVFYDDKLWPQHVLYRRWYPPRRAPPPPNEGDLSHDFC